MGKGNARVHLSDSELTNILSDAKVIASVGVISDPETTGYQAASYQQSQGYKVIPVNHAKHDMILGHETVGSISDVTEPVDIVNVFGHKNEAMELTNQAIASGARTLWFEPGASSHDAIHRAEEAGLQVVAGRSFMNEHRRLVGHRQQ